MNAGRASDSCLNCGEPVLLHFCARCGQKNHDLRASLHHLALEMASEAFEFDSRIRRTLTPFFLRPGLLTREYNAGRRMRYSSPLRIYLFASFVFFLAFSLRRGPNANQFRDTAVRIQAATQAIPSSTVSGGAVSMPSGLQNLDKLGWFGRRLREKTEKYTALDDPGRREAAQRVRAEFVNSLPKVMFLLLPLFALILKGLYRSRYYVEHLIFAFHLHAFAFLALIPAVLIRSTWLGAATTLLILAYLLIAMRSVYAGSWPATVLKFVLLLIPYGLFELAGLSGAAIMGYLAA